MAGAGETTFLVGDTSGGSEHFVDGVGEGLGILRVHLNGGVSHGFRQRGGVAGDDGTAAGHGFERGNPKTFVGGGEDEHFGTGVEFVELVHAHVTKEVDAGFKRWRHGFINL